MVQLYIVGCVWAIVYVSVSLKTVNSYKSELNSAILRSRICVCESVSPHVCLSNTEFWF